MISESNRRDAFLTLLGGCEGRLRAFLAGAVAAADERADLFQDVVLILWRSFEKYDRARPFGPWAMGVAVRRMKEEYRRKRRRPGLLPEDHLERLAQALEAGASGPADQAEREAAALAECLAGLPSSSAALVRRRYFDEAETGLLCAEFGQSAAALYQNLSRLRRKLADCVRLRLRLEDAGAAGASAAAVSPAAAAAPLSASDRSGGSDRSAPCPTPAPSLPALTRTRSLS